MKSITVHGLDESIEALIKKRAKKEGTSLNRTIKKLLKESLGIGTDRSEEHNSDFRDLCGVWARQDQVEFDRNTKALVQVDPRDWQ